MTNIKNSLKLLGIKKTNHGTSVGLNSYGSGKEITSYSPVDGKKIGSVTETTVEAVTKLFNTFIAIPEPNSPK